MTRFSTALLLLLATILTTLELGMSLRTPGVKGIARRPLPKATNEFSPPSCFFTGGKDIDVYHIVYSLCGTNRKVELMRSIKSLVLLTHAELIREPESKSRYHIHIITDGSVTIQQLPDVHSRALCYTLQKPNPLAAPLFAPCSTQRLYLHDHKDFENIQQVTYLDTDTLWLDTPRKILADMIEIDESNAHFGMAMETSDKNSNASWYKGGFSNGLPYHGDYGLNAGVLHLNLKSLRKSDFTRERDKIIKHFLPKKALPLGDQDVLNAYAHKYPQCIHVMPCTFNFRSDSGCYAGYPMILHGNRNLKEDRSSTYSTLYNFIGEIKSMNNIVEHD